MLGSPEEIVVGLVLFITLVIGVFIYIREGLFSPMVVLLVFLVLGMSVRRFVLGSWIPPQGSFWEKASPMVSREMLGASAGTLVFIIVALAVRAVSWRLVGPKQLRLLNIFSVDPLKVRFFLTALIWLVAVLGYVVGLAVLGGGVASAFSMLQKRALLFGSEIFFLKLLLTVMSVSSTVMLFSASSLKYRIFTPQMQLSLLAALATCTLLFLSGGRGATLSQLFVYYLVSRSRANLRNELLAISALTLTAFVIITVGFALRITAQRNLEFAEAAKESAWASGETFSHAFCVIDLFASARYYASVEGHDYGQQFVNYTTRFIPRSIYPNKPEIIGLRINTLIAGNSLTAAPPTILGEFYIAFGELGMVVGGVFLGLVMGVLTSCYKALDSNRSLLVFYATVLTIFIFDSFRAGLEMSVFLIMYSLTTLVLLNAINSLVTSIKLGGNR